MDILIYGAGVYCSNLIKKVRNRADIVIRGIADSNAKGKKDGYTIIKVEEGNISRDINVVIAMASVNNALQIARKLERLGYSNIYLYLNKHKSFIGDFFKGECIRLVDLKGCVMPSAEMHVVDYCNLNCRGCTHFSPIFREELPDFNKRIQDIKKISKLYDKIILFSLLGGEPLLNPEIDKYIISTRELLPDTEIRLVTNGILILRINEEILKIIHKYKITVVISEYKPTHMVIKEICDKLERFQIDYSIRTYDVKQKFNIPLSISANSKYKWKCISPGCISLCDGKIARCPTLLYVTELNKRFGIDLPTQGIYELRNFDNGEELLRELNKPVELCRHCVENEVTWSVCKKEVHVTDFLVYEGER